MLALALLLAGCTQTAGEPAGPPSLQVVPANYYSSRLIIRNPKRQTTKREERNARRAPREARPDENSIDLGEIEARIDALLEKTRALRELYNEMPPK